ncbi:TonB-dependent receptor plug domain-containing protein [uncultured Sphingomonas sp.]|uniref:TonB-dependent receptor plug domain-containing protein n=1 Tax=uncultured Sphingomonas sp. TaxID=158754 RepID=UPI0035CC7F12
MKYLFLPAVLIAGAASAQTLPDDETDVVVTATRVEQAAAEVGQAVTVIKRDEIERRQTTMVADLLATTPGVTVTRNGGLGGVTGVRIRGAEADQTLVVIDGVRVNDPSSPGGAFDFANLLSSSVERIEVVRGPNSVPWGSQAIGGVVNIITAQAREGLQARASAEYGYADTAFANAGISGAKNGLSGSLSGGYLRTDGISAAAAGAERDGYRQYGASGRIGYEVTPGIGIDLRGYAADSRTQLDGFPAPAFTFADTPEYSTTQELYGYAGVHANTADGRFNNRLAFTIADVNRDNFDPTFGDEPSFIGRGRTERYEYQGDLRPIDRVRLVVGAEHETSRYADGTDRFDVGITSFYGEAIVKPIEMLTITGGVRNDDHEAFGNHTTFGADAALALATGTTVRASYGEGFKAPTLYQLYGPFGTRTLEPETARNYDVGVEQALLGGRAIASATYFNRRTRNQIDFDLGTFTYANIARTRAEGVELTLALRPVDALTFSANYTYIGSRNRSPGANFDNDLARRPRQTISANVDYRFPFGLSLGGTLSHVGDSFDNAANTVRLDGYVLASVRAEMPIAERLSIYGRVENIGDERYQVVRGYGTYGRAAYGGVRFRFD